jgi:hypothetical protein
MVAECLEEPVLTGSLRFRSLASKRRAAILIVADFFAHMCIRSAVLSNRSSTMPLEDQPAP